MQMTTSVRLPGVSTSRQGHFTFLDRTSWLLLAPETRSWELAGTISGTAFKTLGTSLHLHNAAKIVGGLSGSPANSIAPQQV
jgi:hypothetical protein